MMPKIRANFVKSAHQQTTHSRSKCGWIDGNTKKKGKKKEVRRKKKKKRRRVNENK
jgi:hypothetical protein